MELLLHVEANCEYKLEVTFTFQYGATTTKAFKNIPSTYKTFTFQYGATTTK